MDLGRVVSFVPSLVLPVVFMELFDTTRNVYCLSRPKSDKVFEMTFKKVSLWSEVDQIGS